MSIILPVVAAPALHIKIEGTPFSCGHEYIYEVDYPKHARDSEFVYTLTAALNATDTWLESVTSHAMGVTVADGNNDLISSFAASRSAIFLHDL